MTDDQQKLGPDPLAEMPFGRGDSLLAPNAHDAKGRPVHRTTSRKKLG